MNQYDELGMYGKLPAHGDFVFRNLNPSVINAWDEWLQLYVSVSREQIGDDWLDIYLTSPLWRFALSPGVLDEHAWAGIIMPSVDRVGRYFPFSMLRRLPAGASPVNFVLRQQAWYSEIEACCLQALEGRMNVDELLEATSVVGLAPGDRYRPTTHNGEQGDFLVGIPADADDALGCAVSHMLDSRLSTEFASYSLWQSEGSELIPPLMFCSAGLPVAAGVPAMMDGQWQLRGWKIPFNLQV
jgi:type VI secretion system protein ImpM